MLKNLILISFLFTGIFSLTIPLHTLVYAQNSSITAASPTKANATETAATKANATETAATKANATETAATKANATETAATKANATEIKTPPLIPKSFNIAVASDWGCNKDAQKTANNIQSKNPELVIAGGDLSYEGSGECWTDIIAPFESKTTISMGDHEYHDTDGGKKGAVNDYLKPLGMRNTYYSFNLHNVHLVAIDPYVDYGPNSAQYKFVVNDLKNANNNPNIDWIFVTEHIPLYSSPSKHPADSTIRDIFHPLFDKYNVDLVFSGDNHNYQRTYPLTYNTGDSSIPIISKKDHSNYKDDKSGVIYIITGTAGRSHYQITQQAPFVAKQDDTKFGFLNIDIISDNALVGKFYADEKDLNYNAVSNTNQRGNILDQFTISKLATVGSRS
jgi:hypothetical protein